jgi:hypothetical protein
MMLTATSPEVLDFAEAYQENVSLARKWAYKIVAIDRRKYVAIDETDEGPSVHRSGRFLVDREDGTVYTIKGYGQKGYRIGTLSGLAQQYREGTATFRPEATAHTETTHSRVARWAS